MKLTDTQYYHLQILNKQKGPMLGSTLAQNFKAIRSQTLESLVAKKLVRVRKTEGRKDRYEILAAGRILLKQPTKKR